MSKDTSAVNISFRQDLLREIDEVAQSESRSRSELVREAARMYIERKKRVQAILDSTHAIAGDRGISQEDVDTEIAAYRTEKRS